MTKANKKGKQHSTLSSILPWLSRSMGWEKQLDLHSIFVYWQDIVGHEFREHAQPKKIERGVLWLEVENSSWLQQLQFAKMELMELLNRRLQLTGIRDIKMILPKDDEFKKHEKPGPAVSFVRPNAAKIAAFQKQVECIADEKCREALMQFWYLAEACKRETK
jgi:hypothetical protein